jgi:high affinity Mn2+ porin
LNWEQEVAKDVGLFSRLGWNDGQQEAWTFTDVNWTASLGISIKGHAWGRSDDTFGLAGAVSGASRQNQRFLEAGGLDMGIVIVGVRIKVGGPLSQTAQF